MQEIAGYQVVRRLGEGGMGSVYLAEAPDGQQVAVKVIRSELLEREEFRERFRREVARAQTVPPFCTAEVIAADPDHEPPYLVIEYVDGPTLFQVVQEGGPLQGATLHGLAVGVATALAAIHGAGVIHRDLKPGNVLLPRGSIKVIDFGIAREVDSDTGSLTTGNQVIGTIPYTSPERLGGVKTLTPAADIFAWGGVVTFAATARTPFYGAVPAETAISILSDPPDLEGLKGPLRGLVERALAKDPADRPTARELLDLLLTATPAAPRPADPTAIEVGTTMPVLPAKRRWRRGLTVTGAGSLVLLAIAAGLYSGGWKLLDRHADAGPTPSLAPAATASPSPGRSPTPSPSPSPTTSLVGGDLIPLGLRFITKMDLTQENGTWRSSERPGDASCVIGSGGLTARLEPDWPTFQCRGQMDQATDFAAYVNVKTDGNSCGTIWFRFQVNGSDGPGISQPDGGYALQVCGDTAYFIAHNSVYRTLLTMPLRTSVAGRTSRIGIIAKGSEFRFYQDGVQIGVSDSDTFQIGRIVLGIFKRHDHPSGRYSATFTNLVIYGTAITSG